MATICLHGSTTPTTASSNSDCLSCFWWHPMLSFVDTPHSQRACERTNKSYSQPSISMPLSSKSIASQPPMAPKRKKAAWVSLRVKRVATSSSGNRMRKIGICDSGLTMHPLRTPSVSSNPSPNLGTVTQLRYPSIYAFVTNSRRLVGKTNNRSEIVKLRLFMMKIQEDVVAT